MITIMSEWINFQMACIKNLALKIRIAIAASELNAIISTDYVSVICLRSVALKALRVWKE